MAEELGRELGSNEMVHHIDGDKLNNTPENLSVVSRSEHCREHADIFRELLWLRRENERMAASMELAVRGYELEDSN